MVSLKRLKNMDLTNHQDRRNPGTPGHPSGSLTGKIITISKSGSSTKEPSSVATLNKLQDMYIIYIFIFMIIFQISDVTIATDDMRDTFLDITEKILVPSLQ